MSGDIFTYDRFEPGVVIGHQELEVDGALLDSWNDVYGGRQAGKNHLPLGVVSVIIMRAHSAVVNPRPPGNLHVGQRFTVHAPISMGQRMRATVTCQDKRISGARRIVTFAVGVTDAESGKPLFDGINTIFWAA